MRSGLVKWYAAALAALALVRPASAQDVAIGRPSCPPPPACPAPAPLTAPTTPTTPETAPTTPITPAPQEPSVDPLAFGATGGGESFAAVSTAVGYIDSALPISQIRIRDDNAYDSNRPDRAEFFYAKCGCLAGPPLFQTNAKGPPLPESRINSYQDISAYIEYAPIQRASAFVEVPYRFINPDANANANGFSDINAGFKYAWIYNCDRIVTTQLRVYAPTGDSQAGLGTHHSTLEPALLFFQRLTPRWQVEGEFRDWIPMGGSDFSGNVVRYGIGTAYNVWSNCNQRIRVFPVVEFVGWSVLSGKESTLDGTPPIKSAAGETIVNGKFGVRTQLGAPMANGIISRADVYLGYGRALTGDFWYKDIVRAELRVRY
jgi:hypothetical protein